MARRPSLRSVEERNALAEANLRLVGYVVGLLARGGRLGVGEEDALQEGALGLLRAAELWDESRGIEFSTYAVYWIKQAIFRSMEAADLIPVPAYVKGGEREATRARLRPVRLHGPADPDGWWLRGGDGEGLAAAVPQPEPERPVRYDFDRVLSRCVTTQQRAVLEGRARGETDTEIGERLGLTRSRVHQIRHAAFAAVREAAAAGVDFEVDD